MVRLLIPILLSTLLGGAASAQARRDADKSPKVGAKAPDFVLHRLTAKGEKSPEKVKLSEVCKKRPVALVFGSYT